MTSEQERERLTAVYSGMSDEELQKIAKSGDELSDVAQQALESEIARRGLTVTIAPPPGIDVYELNEIVTIRKYRDLPEALLAKGGLESVGIQADLVDDNTIRLDWFWSNLLGGIKLKVRPDDVDTANEILSQPIPERIEIEGVGEYEQPKCPQCYSLDVNYQELEKISYVFAFFRVPIPFHKKAWTCHACRAEWEGTNPGDQNEGRSVTP